ncbi:MAG: hypothetical protein HYU76_00235 [Betaproteobacteria bacterium]|nr:hypothetical protein [Betaproteobacteria bacterium]
MVIALLFSVAMISRSDFLTNVGFLVLGALIAMFTTLLGDAAKRPAQARDLARALYEELADRAARCCIDCEAPWHEYLDINNCSPGNMDSFRLRKFAPSAPIIYQSTAGHLAILENDAPQALIKFYHFLAAWERDIKNIAAESQNNKGGVAPDAVQFLARRLHQTLAPGLRALQALSSLVDEYAKIEAAAIAGYDDMRRGTRPKGTLRERMAALAGMPPNNGLQGDAPEAARA